MLDSTARYVYEVYRLKSVSNAANSLFISQPAISAAIRKAEKDFGAPIFNRKTLPFTLTEEGKIYIAALEKMLALENQAAAQLRDIQEIQSGTLRIVAGDPISFRVIPRILAGFHQQHPQVEVNVLSFAAERIYEMVDKDLADILFCPLPYEKQDYPTITLFQPRSVVLLPENAPVSPELRAHAVSRETLLSSDFPVEKLVKDYSLFKDVPFLHIPSIPFVLKRRAELFGKTEVTSRISSSSSEAFLNYNMMRNGFGAMLITDAQIAVLPAEPGCVYFALGGPNALQPYTVAYSNKRSSENFTPLRAFLDAARDFFQCENPLQKLLDP